jgi:hypothetical protein
MNEEANSAKKTRAPNEGLLFFSFTFDGKRQTYQHKLGGAELRTMKGLLQEFGPDSVDSVFVKQLFSNSKEIVQAVIAKAFVEYLKENYKAPEKLAVETDEVAHEGN